MFDTDKLITVYFPAYAGGKFLTNCLALSKHATFQHQDIAIQDLTFKENAEPNYYDWKLQTALKSITHQKNNLKGWRENENYGCLQLADWHSMWEYEPVLSNAVKLLIEKNNTNFFLIAHNKFYLQNILNYFPNTKILRIDNYQDFMIKAFSVKTDKNFKKDKHFLLTISDFNKHKDDIKVDYTIDYANIFDEDKFVLELKKLYSKLNYDDFNINNIKTFYKEYISLHN